MVIQHILSWGVADKLEVFLLGSSNCNYIHYYIAFWIISAYFTSSQKSVCQKSVASKWLEETPILKRGADGGEEVVPPNHWRLSVQKKIWEDEGMGDFWNGWQEWEKHRHSGIEMECFLNDFECMCWWFWCGFAELWRFSLQSKLFWGIQWRAAVLQYEVQSPTVLIIQCQMC